MKKILSFLHDDDGPTAVEYAVMLALILLACLAAVTVIGSATSSSFYTTNSSIQAAMGGS